MINAHTQERQIFEALGYVWDITAALELVNGREPEDHLDVATCASLLRIVAIDQAHAATVDLTKPVLLAPIIDPDTGKPGHYMPIDGWHRIYRAHREDVATLPAIALTPEEERQVRLRGADPKRSVPSVTACGEPYEYTVAGSPVAVSRADDSPVIHIDPLPGGRTLDGSLESITLDEAENFIRSLRAALDQEEN